MSDIHEPHGVHKLEEKANEIRTSIIKMLIEAKSGHVAGPLDMADIFTALYFEILHIDPENPLDPQRDRVVLSNGHICPVWYATLAHRGYFPMKELSTLRKLGSRLQGHPHVMELPGLENSGGPLGQGLSQAIGMALSAKLNGEKHRIYSLGSDAELQEGQTWEAAMYAGNRRLHNLTWIIDRNNIQIDGFTEDVMPLEPLRDKLEAFNWYVLEIDGHNFDEIIGACEHAKAVLERPTVIIAHTIAGKGVDFMEGKYEWHSRAFKGDEAKNALSELRTLGGKIRSEHQ
ncbi:transketolase [candidate division WWE3 bacterium RIFCSPHIGHO2_01_FULL_40_23]|uniref:Transketolase n=1 Tax=candidate division WWE3 bacterium RIFCSPLOWO2_01_FULL_41_18 TaxID=1802625 RepID=A0A1F4VF23_UNCKA|nr:MAG: transketolase [candidate division WWE3 bacterium RIFCSPHIGHO2_01_FULL_40_23]OGC55755.1 MAG: transketolase [candidate division WWE3 bacterium RIFCSPLOWO2_01_FULL_41_18]